MNLPDVIFGIHHPAAVAEQAAIIAKDMVLAKRPVSGLGTTGGPVTSAEAGAILGVVVGVLVAVVAVRGAMGYYIGKKFGRPGAGAVMGGLFGAPGMGVTALFGKGS